MPNVGPQGNHRKSLAVKHRDGEPLTRVDLQYDLLYYLFTDPNAVFTDPYITVRGERPGSRVTFRDLYVNALIHAPRCSKVSRDKLLETPAFADEFAKISLLSNVGRINTTMAFFPEMRTALRTYHPVPSLQKTDGNLQDAPRIKNILKSCLLPSEQQDMPMTPADVLSRSRSGEVPPTNIVNLIFVIASHSAAIAQNHFPQHIPLDVLDFFCPVHYSSESRARAFLWLLYHYHEAPSRNPFDDEYSRAHPDSIPRLEVLSPEEAALENVDTQDEQEWGAMMSEQRRMFLTNKNAMDLDDSGQSSKMKKGRGRMRGRISKPKDALSRTTVSSSKPTREPSPADSTASFLPESRAEEQHEGYADVSRGLSTSHTIRLPPILTPNTSSSRSRSSQDNLLLSGIPQDPFHRRISSPLPPHHRDMLGRRNNSIDRPTLPSLQYVENYNERSPPQTLPPLSIPPSPPLLASRTFSVPSDVDMLPPASHSHGATRSMLEQAWHVVTTTDPLDDSEDEADENTRLDLSLRLRIINRLRGKEPTPEPEPRRRPAELPRSPSPGDSLVTS